MLLCVKAWPGGINYNQKYQFSGLKIESNYWGDKSDSPVEAGGQDFRAVNLQNIKSLPSHIDRETNR